MLDTAAGSIAYRFEGRDLNLVLAPPASTRCASPCCSTASRPGEDHGVDVDDSGEGTLDEPRMYQLVRQRGPVRERLFELHLQGAGTRAYVFTFG